MLKSVGIDKPEYLKAAYDTCDFALENQDAEGAFAKAWDDDGNILAKKGTIGCFLVLPIITAYKLSGDKKYLDSAIRAFDFYYSELEREGFIYTVAGKGSFVAQKNITLLREENLRKIEQLMQQIDELAVSCNLSREEVVEMYMIISEEE
jgi:uncharacterized protein YyaL (SSP411 family)